MKSNRGFSLLETLLYLAIFAVVGGSLFGILTNVVRVTTREVTGDEVSSQLQFAMGTITKLVKDSSSIEISTSTATTTLKLRMSVTAQDPTCITLVNGVLKLAQGPLDSTQGSLGAAQCTNTTVDITTNKVVVESALFKRLEFPGGHDQVLVDMQLSNTATGVNKISRALRSGISRASAATFDSDLLPNQTGVYEVGSSIGKKWKNLSLSGLLNIGTAGSDPSTGMGEGSIYFNTATDIFRGYAGGAWKDIGSSLWVASSTSMYSNVSGNVGIGTNAPIDKLEVVGNTRLDGYIRMKDFDDGVWNGTATGTTILSRDFATMFWHGGVVVGTYANGGVPSEYAATGAFLTKGPTALAVSSGNVGIGTITPSEKLDVNGAANFNAIYKIGPGSNNPERGGWNALWTAVGAGRALYADEEFALGSNSVVVYNNAGGTGVQHFWENGDGSQPNQSGKWVRIVNNGNSTSPGYGGFLLQNVARRNATFVQRFRAKLPVGYTLVIAENPQGTNNTSYWLTPTAGTGKWEEYIRVSHSGNTGTFSSGGHVYVSGTNPIFTWYLASANMYEVDSPPGIFSGSVGIGTASPEQKLHINGTSVGSDTSQTNISAFVNNGIRITGVLDSASQDAITYRSGSGGGAALAFGRNAGFGTYTAFYTNNTASVGAISERMRIDSAGNVGIGTTGPGYKLEVNGNSANATGVWAVSSDSRLKRDVAPIKDALQTIMALQGVGFNWKDKEKDDKFGRVMGFVAQDVEQVLPQWVKTGADGYKKLETIGMDALIIEAIKEQQYKFDAQIMDLKNQIRELKEHNK